MFVGARQLGASQLEAEDMGQYQELIELQKQIVKVAEQNAVTQQRCARLREQLDREVNALIGPRRPVHERLRDATRSRDTDPEMCAHQATVVSHR